MKADSFYQQVTEGAAQPPHERHKLFSELHSQVVIEYLATLRKITPDLANQVVAGGADHRTLTQVVGHIAAWEQFTILAAGDILAGVQHPRLVTSVDGFIDADGQTLNFPTIHAFNAYQAAKQAGWSWQQVLELAKHTATTLHLFFTHPLLLSAERLESTRSFRKRLENGTVINNVAMGWNLWITLLEHEAVEHAAELEMDQVSR